MPMIDPEHFEQMRLKLGHYGQGLGILVERRRRGDFTAADIVHADGHWTEAEVKLLESLPKVPTQVFRRYLDALQQLERQDG